MISQKKAWKICMEIYKELYKKSNPPADFEQLMKTGETKKQDWFMNYYLEINRQTKIIEEHIKKNKVDKYMAKNIRNTISLGCSPNSSKERWLEINK